MDDMLIQSTLRELVPDLHSRAMVRLKRRREYSDERCTAQLLTVHPESILQGFRRACNARRRSQAGVIREAMLRFIAEVEADR